MAAYEKMIETLKEADRDVVAGYGGNKAAQTRARKALQEVRALVQEVRNELLATGKGESDAQQVSRAFSQE